MEQKILFQAQIRLDQLKDLKHQVEDVKNQVDEKEREISEFKREWQSNCKHVFYKVQSLSVASYTTLGYHCCLCGIFEKPPRTRTPSLGPHPSKAIRYLRMKSYKSHFSTPSHCPMPPKEKETHDFIGTVTHSNLKSAGTQKEKDRFPIPPEYKAEVDFKRNQLDKLKSERELLVEKLKELKAAANAIEQELDEVAHLLNSYFGYPKIEIRTVYVDPHRSREDKFYDD